MKFKPAGVTAKLEAGKGETDNGRSTYKVTVRSDRYARGIFLSIDNDPSHHFSDNYFDLLPGEQRTISLSTLLSKAEVERTLHTMVYRH